MPTALEIVVRPEAGVAVGSRSGARKRRPRSSLRVAATMIVGRLIAIAPTLIGRMKTIGAIPAALSLKTHWDDCLTEVPVPDGGVPLPVSSSAEPSSLALPIDALIPSGGPEQHVVRRTVSVSPAPLMALAEGVRRADLQGA